MRIALIPAYEPEPVLIDLLGELKNAGFETVVVDDGSGEGYAAVFSRAEKLADVLSYPNNLGKGSALKTGLKYIYERFGEDNMVVTMDADGQHSVADAQRVCERAEIDRDALVLGSRALKGGVPLRSRMGNAITRFVYRTATGLKVHDTQTGLRAFSAAMIPRLLDIQGERYEYEMNQLLVFAKNKSPIIEIEISTIYIDNNSGSHFNTARDSFRIYKEILKFSASSLLSFLLDYGLYSLLSALLPAMGTAGVVVSNVTARVVSATFNFTLNRRLVFDSKSPLLAAAVKYFLLAAFILASNTVVLNLLIDRAGVNRYLAKIITELIFFTVSWLVQRTLIFQKNILRKEKIK